MDKGVELRYFLIMPDFKTWASAAYVELLKTTTKHKQ